MMIKCACKNCLSEGTVKTTAARRGERAVYMCAFHAESLLGYTTENTFRMGTEKVNPFTYGVELETSFSTEKARAEILLDGYLPTSDCTVNVEYKSPIYNGLNAVTKHAATFGNLIDAGELSIGDECGTHFHVGHKTMINAETMGYIRRFYNSLFVPLSREMESHPEATERLFGRNFGHWAQPINMGTCATEHTNFVNTQHTYSLEWRIVKFRNADQFMNAARCCKAMTEAVVNNFVEHFNDEPKDARRYPTIRDYRLHKAQVAAEKIVKIFKKYAGI